MHGRETEMYKLKRDHDLGNAKLRESLNEGKALYKNFLRRMYVFYIVQKNIPYIFILPFVCLQFF